MLAEPLVEGRLRPCVDRPHEHQNFHCPHTRFWLEIADGALLSALSVDPQNQAKFFIFKLWRKRCGKFFPKLMPESEQITLFT